MVWNHNQEDSIIFNNSSCDRGLFRATALKKYDEVLKKNQSTSQDEKFTKPDKNLTSGMKETSAYAKLNDEGYVPEETEVVYGDMLIGKVTPTQPKSGAKPFKDSSHPYKSIPPAVIDKVYTKIYDADGYERYKMRVRSERRPNIGDKFGSRHG